MGSFIETSKREIKKRAKKGRVILGLSGGVDSTVTSILIKQSIGEKLFVIFINNGFLREGESSNVIKNFHRGFR